MTIKKNGTEFSIFQFDSKGRVCGYNYENQKIDIEYIDEDHAIITKRELNDIIKKNVTTAALAKVFSNIEILKQEPNYKKE